MGAQGGHGGQDRQAWRQLLGVTWRDHEPHLRVRFADGDPSVVLPLAGQTLRYRTDDGARITCVGHVPFRSGAGDYFECMRAPETGSRVCSGCAIVEATFASNLHHAHTRGSAELDPSIARHLAQPNRLYLAGFRDGSVKVGTSTLGRSEKRLEEQGAWIARYVAETTNGRTVRHLEDDVTEQLGVVQSVGIARKRRGLVDPVADHDLEQQLDWAAERITAEMLPRTGPEVTSLNQTWRHPMTDLVRGTRIIDYPLRLTRGRHDLELVSAIGRLVLARRRGGSDVFVLDPAPLFGRWLDAGDYGSDEIAIQDSLF